MKLRITMFLLKKIYCILRENNYVFHNQKSNILNVFPWLLAFGMLAMPWLASFRSMEVETKFLWLLLNSYIATFSILFWVKYKCKLNEWNQLCRLITGLGLLLIFTLSIFSLRQNYESAIDKNEKESADYSIDIKKLRDDCGFYNIKFQNEEACRRYELHAIRQLSEARENKPLNDGPWIWFAAFLSVFQGGLVAAFLYAWATSPLEGREKQKLGLD